MTTHNTFTSVRDFIEHVDRDRFQTTLGHTPQVVSRAIARNVMPAHWFLGVRGLCNELGILTPENLFQWSRPEPANKSDNKQYAKSPAEIQGAAE